MKYFALKYRKFSQKFTTLLIGPQVYSIQGGSERKYTHMVQKFSAVNVQQTIRNSVS